MKRWAFLLALLPIFLQTCNNVPGDTQVPFDYDLSYTVIPGEKSDTIICLHGFGGDHRIAERIKENAEIQETLVSFNFPDFGIRDGSFTPEKTSFGSIRELEPIFYALKKCVIDGGLEKVSLYGFSAGGGALVNTLAVLNSDTYAGELHKLGIFDEGKQKILNAIQNGYVLLDTPQKSVQEIIDFRGSSPTLEAIAKKYRDNDFIPIDSLQKLQGLSLRVLVHFQEKDEILSNRDDDLYIGLIKKYNSGVTHSIIADDGGHNSFHASLWNYYFQLVDK